MRFLLFITIALSLGWYFEIVPGSGFMAICCLAILVLSVVIGPKPANPPNGSLIETLVGTERKLSDGKSGSPKIQSLVGTVIEEQMRKERDKQSVRGKIRQCRFSAQEISDIEHSMEGPKDVRAAQATSDDKNRERTPAKMELSFKTLQELDYFLPSIEGTWNDFIQAAQKFRDALSHFFDDAEERQADEMLSMRHYPKLSDFLVEKALQHKRSPSVVALLKGVEFRRLQYGHCFTQVKRDTSRHEQYNVKLYKEIVCLFQELFVRYSNEIQKHRYNSLEELLEKNSLESLEKLYFEISLEDLGNSISDILIENFLNILKLSKNHKNHYPTEYRSLRLLLRSGAMTHSVVIGQTTVDILREIQDTYDMIQKQTAIKSRQEIAKLIETTRVVPKFQEIPRDRMDLSVAEKGEKDLSETVLTVVKFLGWIPQDPSLITEEEKNLVAYFNKLMYSRRTRLAVAEQREDEGTKFRDKLSRVMEKLKEAEELFGRVSARHQGNLVGVEVEIFPPRQSEDYFPLRGIIERVVRVPFQNVGVLDLEIRETNGLKSTVTFTGNNIDFG